MPPSRLPIILRLPGTTHPRIPHPYDPSPRVPSVTLNIILSSNHWEKVCMRFLKPLIISPLNSACLYVTTNLSFRTNFFLFTLLFLRNLQLEASCRQKLFFFFKELLSSFKNVSSTCSSTSWYTQRGWSRLSPLPACNPAKIVAKPQRSCWNWGWTF